jgi:hypothetical protein
MPQGIRSHCPAGDLRGLPTGQPIYGGHLGGAVEPYEKLRRALRAEVNEDVWRSLYSTTSRAFDRPQSGKIAVKVINHYGDEVLKVFEV